jgi:4-amino-4-deoxy-L-arabinose transferase-like glycosyltransferase
MSGFVWIPGGLARVHRLKILICLIVVVAAALCCRGEGQIDIMEARNYISAREVLQSGEWLIPTLNGEDRLAKPPLPTWIATIPMAIVGDDADLSANRVPSGLAGCFMALGCYLLARRLFGRDAALDAVLILACSAIFIMMTRRNTWDIYANAFMVWAIFFLHTGLTSPGRSLARFAAATGFMWLSFMSKGPTAFYAMLLPYLGAVAASGGWAWLRGRWRLLAGSLAAALALSLVWPAAVHFQTSGLGQVASQEATAWFSRHIEPFWFYLITIPLLAGLWLPYLLLGLRRPAPGAPERRERLLVLVWLVGCVVLLSIIPEKKDRYILPAVIPAVMLTAVAVRDRIGAAGRLDRLAWRICLGVFGLVMAAAPAVLLYLEWPDVLGVGHVLALWAFGAVALRSLLCDGRGRFVPLTAVGVLAALLSLTPYWGEVEKPNEHQAFYALRQEPYASLDLHSLREMSIKNIYAAGQRILTADPQRLLELAATREVGVVSSEPLPVELDGATELLTTIQGDRPYRVFRVTP